MNDFEKQLSIEPVGIATTGSTPRVIPKGKLKKDKSGYYAVMLGSQGSAGRMVVQHVLAPNVYISEQQMYDLSASLSGMNGARWGHHPDNK